MPKLSEVAGNKPLKLSQVQASPPQKPRGYVGDRLAELKALGQGARYSVAETALGAGQLLGAADSNDVQAFRDKRDAARQQAAQESPRGEAFFGGGQTVGEVGQAMLPIGAVGKGLKFTNYARAGAAGGAYGASRPIVDGESRGKNTLVAAGSNIAGTGLAHMIGAAGKVAPKFSRDVFNAGQDRGVDLTFAQMTKSDFLKRAAHMADRLPFSGAGARFNRQNQAVNKGVADELGAQVNADGLVDAGSMTQRFEDFGPQFDAVLKNGMKMDAPFARKVGELWKFVGEELDDGAQKYVDTIVRRIEDQGSTGKFTGDTLQSLDRSLREAGAGGSDKARVAKMLRDELHDAFGRSASPDVRQVWAGVRNQYRKFLQVEPAVARNPDGLLATQLHTALTATKRGKQAITRGRGDELNDLGLIGRQLRQPSSSGTAENIQAAALGANAGLNPLAALLYAAPGYTVGKALNSNTLARLMMSEGRGQIAPLAPLARPLPFLLSGSAYADRPKRP